MRLRIGIIDSLLFNFYHQTEYGVVESHDKSPMYHPNNGIHLLFPFIKLNTLCQVPPVEIIIFSTLAELNDSLFYQSLNQHGLSDATVVFTTTEEIATHVTKMSLNVLLSLDEQLCAVANTHGILSVTPHLNSSYGKLKILFDCPFFNKQHVHSNLMALLKVLGYIQKSSHVFCDIGIWVNERYPLTQQIRDLFYLADCQIDSVIYDSNCDTQDVLYFLKPHLSFLTEDVLEYSNSVLTVEDKNFLLFNSKQE
ncbi:MAG TPA: hypothetical protein DCY20_09185 [Firmicutes bacterium]|nr:hypothetical protein [Bacillota bacterium]